jgi:flagellar biosynthesis/type III secretory pathway protein FliH
VQDIIEDSWVYQETIQKGREEGLEKGGQQALQTAAISIVVARFPELEQLAREIIATIGDQSRLQTLIVELSVTPSQEHAKQLLLSLVSAA